MSIHIIVQCRIFIVTARQTSHITYYLLNAQSIIVLGTSLGIWVGGTDWMHDASLSRLGSKMFLNVVM